MRTRLTLLLLLVSTIGQAFWVPSNLPGHGSITTDAMQKVGYLHPPENVTLTFHEDVYDKIIAGNTITDRESEYRYSPADHFDNEEFENGAKRT